MNYIGIRDNPKLKDYYEYFNLIIDAYSSIVSKHGKDSVWRSVCCAGGERVYTGRSRIRTVRIPADADEMEDSSVFMEFSTNPKALKFHLPSLYKKIDRRVFKAVIPGSLPEEEREKYREKLLGNLERLKRFMDG
jgi:hypothetical protein